MNHHLSQKYSPQEIFQRNLKIRLNFAFNIYKVHAEKTSIQRTRLHNYLSNGLTTLTAKFYNQLIYFLLLSSLFIRGAEFQPFLKKQGENILIF